VPKKSLPPFAAILSRLWHGSLNGGGFSGIFLQLQDGGQFVQLVLRHLFKVIRKPKAHEAHFLFAANLADIDIFCLRHCHAFHYLPSQEVGFSGPCLM